MAARKKNAAQSAQSAQLAFPLVSAEYVIKDVVGGMTWYRASWADLRVRLPQDERAQCDPGHGSSVFWTTNPGHAERYTAPPPGWTWDRLSRPG